MLKAASDWQPIAREIDEVDSCELISLAAARTMGHRVRDPIGYWQSIILNFSARVDWNVATLLANS